VPIVPPTRPRFKNVPLALTTLLWDLTRGAPAPLVAVERRLFSGMTPPPRVSSDEFIPTDSPFIAIFNHYESESAASWWGPFLMTGVIAERRTHARRLENCPGRVGEGVQRIEPRGDATRIRWLMAREWWYPRGFGRHFKQPLTRLFFERLARVYGFVRVPPVLNGDLTRGEGVAGVRQALALTRGDDPALVGLAPEGNTGPGGALREPPSGAGLFLLHLTHEKIPLLPIGWYDDEEGDLTIRFGEPFHLHLPKMNDRRARDRAAATQAMTAIGRLLPRRLWGAYREEISQEVNS
jgi:hypothetical protein